MCRVFLRELANCGIRLDVYSENDAVTVQELQHSRHDNVRFLTFPYQWDWNSWYGRNRKVAFIVSFLKRLRSYRRMTDALLTEHRKSPYDAVIQFSQGELFRLGRYADEVPIILFPCVHAAGELHWCRTEAHLARQCEPMWWRFLRNNYLAYRARLQRRDYHLASGVIGMSRRFNRWVGKDYGIPKQKLGVVYHPIELPAGGGAQRVEGVANGRVRLLFAGRISVRKGIDLLIKVLPRLLDEDSEIEVAVIGAGSLWSNYEPLLKNLPEGRCKWLKSLPNDEVVRRMRHSDILLVPSLYEPGGIVVGEALACGMTVVASDEVGSAENLPEDVCDSFPTGDAEAFLTAIRKAVERVRLEGKDLRRKAVETAAEQFDPEKMARLLLNEVSRLLGKPNVLTPAPSA